MNNDLLVALGKILGIGGIAVGTFLILFREIIRKNIFAVLTKADTYRLMRWITVLVWSVAFLGIAAYVYVAMPGDHRPFRYRGSVRDTVSKSPVANAQISFLGRTDIAPQQTDRNGFFSFTLESKEGKFNATVQVRHDSYSVWEKALTLTSDTVEDVLLSTERPPEFTLSGEVLDEQGRTVEGIVVRLDGQDSEVQTDRGGRFKLVIIGRLRQSFVMRAFNRRGTELWSETGTLLGDRDDIVIPVERRRL